MPLTFTRRDRSSLPIEVCDIRPDDVVALDCDTVARRPILAGRHTVPLGDVFKVSGSASDDHTLIWDGDLLSVKGLGAGMSRGTVRLLGPAGMHVGAEMRGGQIFAECDVGDWAGAEMRGGEIHIAGSAGKCLGGAYRGSLKGMNRGSIFVQGNCGDEAGHLMRRGLIAVAGSAGAGLGFGMLAGSIAVAGRCGPLVGAGMKRGTILLLQPLTNLLPSFRRSSDCELTVIRMLVRHLTTVGLTEFGTMIDQTWQRYCGDWTEQGRGEILFPGVNSGK